MIDDKTFNQVAQAGHFAGGLAFVLGAEILFPGHPLRSFAVLVILAGMKEFWYDYKYETPEVRGSSYEDFRSYLFGGVAANLLLILKMAFQKL